MLTTNRLRVTTWLPEDAEALYELHSNPETMRFVGPRRPETRAETDRRLENYLHEQRTRGWTKWRVCDVDGTMIGRAGFGTSDAGRELGYTLRPESWGQGVATELAQALVRWHREHPDPALPRELWAYAVLENKPSRRVLEKVGFTLFDHREHNASACAYYRLAPATSVS